MIQRQQKKMVDELSGSVIWEIWESGSGGKPVGLQCVWWGTTPDDTKVPRKVVVWRFNGDGELPPVVKMVRANANHYPPIADSSHDARQQTAIGYWKKFKQANNIQAPYRAYAFFKSADDEDKELTKLEGVLSAKPALKE